MSQLPPAPAALGPTSPPDSRVPIPAPDYRVPTPVPVVPLESAPSVPSLDSSEIPPAAQNTALALPFESASCTDAFVCAGETTSAVGDQDDIPSISASKTRKKRRLKGASTIQKCKKEEMHRKVSYCSNLFVLSSDVYPP